jgi:hypothetical protein
VGGEEEEEEEEGKEEEEEARFRNDQCCIMAFTFILFTSVFCVCSVGAAIFVMSGSDVLSLYCVMCITSCP